MSRIVGIGKYVPAISHDNRDRSDFFNADENFLIEKIGVVRRAQRLASEETSDLCVGAFRDLANGSNIDPKDIDAIIVVTQNPDGSGVPHTAAIVHQKIGAGQRCATFDIGQGCAGFVYGLSVAQGLLATLDMKRILLFTCDPYSKIVDKDDRNTALLFGDAATALLMEQDGKPGWVASHFRFRTLSDSYSALQAQKGVLFMDGRAVFNFAAVNVPVELDAVLADAKMTRNSVDVFALHQGSKYIVDTIIRRMKLPIDKVPFEIENVGNTISSSIPLLIADRLKDDRLSTMILCGFGVGLSVATCILKRN